MWNRETREKLVQLFFDKFDVPAIFLGRAAVLSAFALGKHSAMVVDCGASAIRIGPIYEGYLIKAGALHQPLLGGDALSSQATTLLTDEIKIGPLHIPQQVEHKFQVELGQPARVEPRMLKGVTDSFIKYHQNLVVDDFKESVVQVSELPYNGTELARRPPKYYEFPDGYNRNFVLERFRLGEQVFHPSQFRLSTPDSALMTSVIGLAELINKSLQQCDAEGRVRVQIGPSTQERRFGPWIGGSILSSLSTFQQLWLTKQEYKEHGAAYIDLDDPSFSACTSSFRLDRQRQPRKWNQLQLSAETDRIKYRAVNFGEHSAATLPYRYAVAVVDTQDNKAKLFDAELLVAHRIIKSVEEADSVQRLIPKTATVADATSEYYKSKALLGESFGTKKTKQMLSSLDRNRIDMGQLETQSAFISRNLDSSINRLAEAKDADSDSAATEHSSAMIGGVSILPPHNTSTSKVEEIYQMQDLIPGEVYYSLDVSAIVEAIKQKQTEALSAAIAPYQLQEVVLSRVKSLTSLPTLPKGTSLTHTLRCLIYLNFLLVFRALNESKVNSDLSKFLPMATQDLLTALLGQFTDMLTLANGKTRHKVSSLCRDRLITFICIIVLTLDGFRTNVARLSVALQQPATKTVEYMRALGCAIEKPAADEPTKFISPGTGREIAVKMAVLKAPLTIVPAKARGGPPRKK